MRVDKNIIATLFFLMGIVYWYLFYFRGAPAIAHGDWIKEQVYLNTLRLSLEQFLIPWSWEKSFYHSALFMANPEVVFTPDVLLVRVMSNNQFIYLHHCLFYAIGFFSLHQISSTLKLRTSVYLLIYLLFNFNGYITSHISEGHFQWTGYYLIPGFLLFLYQSSQYQAVNRNDVLAGGVLGLLFANGSFHMAIWLSLFATLLFVFERRSWLKFAAVMLVGYGIGAFRIIPALIYFSPASTKGMQTGYTDFSLLLNALTQLRGHGYGATTLSGWWEYSLYVGFTGLLLLTAGFILYLCRELKQKQLKQPWVLAAVVIFLLSLGNTWGILSTFQLPFGSIERLSTRFIIIPFLLTVVVSAYALNHFLDRLNDKTINLFFYILVGFVGVDLFYQLLNWSLIATELASGGLKEIPILGTVDIVPAHYKWTISLAWSLSALAVLASCFYLKRLWPVKSSGVSES
jgi:hypothetical protein